MNSGTTLTYIRSNSAVGTTSMIQRSNVANPRSPAKTPKPKIGSHSYRLYKAPQASIRGDSNSNIRGDSIPNTSLRYEESSSLSTRRRRGENRGTAQQSEGTGFMLERQNSNKSITDEVLSGSDSRILPEVPLFWRDEDKMAAMHSSVPDMSKDRSPLRPRRRSFRIHSGMHDHSDRLLDDHSNQGSKLHTCSYHSRANHSSEEKPPLSSIRSFVSLTSIIQVCVLLLLAVFVYDSHHKVQAHKVRLREYDEERSHILEQMMWIDKAAKKVHNRYTTLLQKDPSLESKEELIDETQFLRDELEGVQLRIQLNARDRIHQLFGDKPLHVNLKVTRNDQVTGLFVALSDDTPHAVATFLQQIDQKLWDDVILEPIEPGVVQVTPRVPTTFPLLEFVERSRGCHEVGSVALRSIVKEELTVLVLKINLIEHAALHDKDVCIGKLLNGLDVLKEISERES